METIGHILKKARESKSLTIAEVNKKTRIHSEVLTALEEGMCDQILSYTYAKSFLKKYCDFLGLDPREILTEYPQARQEKAGEIPMQLRPAEVRKEPLLKPEIKPAIEKARALTIPRDSMKLVFWGGAIIVAIMLVFGLVFAAKKAIGAVKARSKGRLVHTIQPKKAAQPKKDPSFREFYIPKDAFISVTIKTKRSVLVKVKRDDLLVMERVLPKGSRESFKASEKLEIYAAKVEAIDVTVNSKPATSLGKGLKRLEITRKGMRIR